ncbi:hypothetical protein EJB05_45351, partial [Eragrostis curvula]
MGRSLPLTVAVLLLVLSPLVLSGSVSSVRPPKGAWHGFKEYIKSLPGAGGQETDGGEHDNSADTAGANISSILDITTDLVWSQCAPCTACVPAPTFEPNRSGTFSRLPCRSQTCQRVVVNQTCPAANAAPTDDYCGCVASYGDDTNTTGYLANIVHVRLDPGPRHGVTPLVFGCSGASVGDFSGASGVFGFSRGPLSLVSQLELSWFSYFWASDDSGSDSFIQLGDDKVIRTPSSRSTPLLSSTLYPDLYVVNITGIKVGDELQRDIQAGTFDLRANGSGGVFLSTTVPVTFLEEAAYNVVKKAVARRINATNVDGSALGLDLCYTIQSMANLTVPKLALVFDGTDAVMNLKRSNYFHDNTTGLDCLRLVFHPNERKLALFPKTSLGKSVMKCPIETGLTILPYRGASLLSSLLQTDRNMTYDIANGQRSFSRPWQRRRPRLLRRCTLWHRLC